MVRSTKQEHNNHLQITLGSANRKHHQKVKGIRICHPKICHFERNNYFKLKESEKQQVQKGFSELSLLP